MKKEIIEATRRCLLAKHVGCKGCPLCSLNERTSSNCVDFIFENFLDYHNKYQWHDLKRNPNDLPNDDGWYYTKTAGEGPSVYESAKYFALENEWVSYHKVVAWRKIDEYESEE